MKVMPNAILDLIFIFCPLSISMPFMALFVFLFFIIVGVSFFNKRIFVA